MIMLLFQEDFFFGIRAPALRASLRATATACLRLVTFFPLLDFKVPSLNSCITLRTLPFPLVAVFFAIVHTSLNRPTSRLTVSRAVRISYARFQIKTATPIRNPANA